MPGVSESCAREIREVLSKRCCAVCGEPSTGSYMVTSEIWSSAGFVRTDFAHLRCLELRLGRELTGADFTLAPINDTIHWALRRSP